MVNKKRAKRTVHNRKKRKMTIGNTKKHNMDNRNFFRKTIGTFIEEKI